MNTKELLNGLLEQKKTELTKHEAEYNAFTSRLAENKIMRDLLRAAYILDNEYYNPKMHNKNTSACYMCAARIIGTTLETYTNRDMEFPLNIERIFNTLTNHLDSLETNNYERFEEAERNYIKTLHETQVLGRLISEATND